MNMPCIPQKLQGLSEGSPPEEGGRISEVTAALVVGGAAQSHDIVAALLDEHADDALQAVADEVAAHLHRLLLPLHQLLPGHAATRKTSICRSLHNLNLRFNSFKPNTSANSSFLLTSCCLCTQPHARRKISAHFSIPNLKLNFSKPPTSIDSSFPDQLLPGHAAACNASPWDSIQPWKRSRLMSRLRIAENAGDLVIRSCFEEGWGGGAHGVRFLR